MAANELPAATPLESRRRRLAMRSWVGSIGKEWSSGIGPALLWSKLPHDHPILDLAPQWLQA
jgi:hypothetical protein